jgi:hypothetical protein
MRTMLRWLKLKLKNETKVNDDVFCVNDDDGNNSIVY